MDSPSLNHPPLDAQGTTRVRAGTVLLPLGESIFQVGTSPGHSFILTNLTSMEERWLRSLVAPVPGMMPAPVPLKRKRRRGATDPAQQQRRDFILSCLADAGLLEPSPLPALADLRIRLVGLDRIGIPLARILVSSGVRYLDLRDQQLVDNEVEYLFDSATKGRPRVQALHNELRAHKVFLSRQAMPNLTITINPRTIDHHRAAVLLNHDEIHLPIVVEDRSITIGPMLIPGLTCCYLCLDFHRADFLPNWPQLRETLRKRPLPPQSQALSSTVAALTAHIVESIADPASAPTATTAAPGQGEDDPWYLGRSWRVYGGGVETLRWDRHHSCRCSGVPQSISYSP